MKKKNSKKWYQNGNSWVTNLIFIAIIGVFIAALWPLIDPIEKYNTYQDTMRKNDLKAIATALEAYYKQNGRYPSSFMPKAQPVYKIVVATNREPLEWGSSWPGYMNTLPKDPNSDNTYVYYSPLDSDGQTYYLYASLKLGGKDAESCNRGKACDSLQLYNISEFQCGGLCNYGLSSSNVTP